MSRIWVNVSYGGTEIAHVSEVAFIDGWAGTGLGSRSQAFVQSEDFSALIGFAPGMCGTLKATEKQSGVCYVMNNAFVERGVCWGGQWRFGSLKTWFSPSSLDGLTNPLSITIDSLDECFGTPTEYNSASKRRLDAVLVPRSFVKGNGEADRIRSILGIAEPLLLVDRTQGQRAYVRNHPGSRFFVSANSADTMGYPIGQKNEGEKRYLWEWRSDGVGLGFLNRSEATS